MGNSLSTSAYIDPISNASRTLDNVRFFKSLSIESIEYFFEKLAIDTGSKCHFREPNGKPDVMLTWKDYYRIFSSMKDNIAAEKIRKERESWNIATRGYMMEKTPESEDIYIEEPVVVTPVKEGIPDDHTDDEASDLDEDSDGENDAADAAPQEESKTAEASVDNDGKDSTKKEPVQEESKKSNTDDGSVKESTEEKDVSEGSSKDEELSAPKVPKKRLPINKDPSLVSPIFFGYSKLKVADHEASKQKELEAVKIRESRAVESARRAREVGIEDIEKNQKNQAASRLKKMEELKAKYEYQQDARNGKLETNQRELPEGPFKLFKIQWEKENRAAQMAFDEEISSMKKIHEEKTKTDEVAVRDAYLQLEAFREAEDQAMPAGEKLEAIARLEIARWLDVVNQKKTTLAQVRREYQQVREELESKVTYSTDNSVENSGGNEKKGVGTVSRANLKAVQELKSMLNVCETRVREQQRMLQEAMERLLDSGYLLKRAQRILEQQRELLPLFKLLAGISLTESKEDSNNNSDDLLQAMEVLKGNVNASKEQDLPTSIRLDIFAASMTIIMTSNFDVKLHFICSHFDERALREGFFTRKFILRLVMLFQETLQLMKFTTFQDNEMEISNEIWRFFKDQKLHKADDCITEHELRALIFMLTAKSAMLTDLFQIRSPFQVVNTFGTFQRNSMSPIALFQRSLINSITCKYRIHYEATRFRSCLNPRSKQSIHERAMAMGEDDPLRPDYSKLIFQPAQVSSFFVVPLDHGHLMNLEYVRQQHEYQAALKVQSRFRSFRARRMAELEAKHQAFEEAKEMARKEMKIKIVKEYKKRESGSGMGKMKWDAQVRLKQAKLRAAGQSVSRNDTVMIMMEEAIEQGRNEIDKRFRILEEKEDFHGIDFEGMKQRQAAKEKEDAERKANADIGGEVVSMLGLLFQPKVEDTSVLAESIATPREGIVETTKEDDGNRKDKASSSQSLQQVDPLVVQAMLRGGYYAPDIELFKHFLQSSLPPTLLHPLNAAKAKSNKASKAKTGDEKKNGVLEKSLVTLSYDVDTLSSSLVWKNWKSLFHRFRRHPTDRRRFRGETALEKLLRLGFSCPEPAESAWKGRLLSMHDAATLFKVSALLLELPSKRLLVQYIFHHLKNHKESDLLVEMKLHFRFSRGEMELVNSLIALTLSDLEMGQLYRHMKTLQERQESAIQVRVTNKLLRSMKDLRAMIERRLETNETLNETKLLNEEVERAESMVEKFKKMLLAMVKESSEFNERFRKMLMSVREVERRKECIVQVRKEMLDHLPPDVNIGPWERQEWMDRLYFALELPEDDIRNGNLVEKNSFYRDVLEDSARGLDKNPLYIKYAEIRDVCREFLRVVESDAIVLLHEHRLPPYLRSIPIVEEIKGHGRSDIGGRGDNGIHYIYEIHNVRYEVCEDFHGLFNGCDEYAMKMGGKERLHSLEFFKSRARGLLIPLVATVDFHGFRVIASSKLSCEKIIFNEEGEVRKISIDCVHGVQRSGDNFLNKSKIFQNMMKPVAMRLNFAEHAVKGLKDIGISHTSVSADLQVFKYGNTDDRFVATNFWKCYPPEMPSETPHLPRVPRDHSIFWRFLRPEFLRNYPHALSPDAADLISRDLKKQPEEYEQLLAASRYLVDDVLMDLAEFLISRDYVLPVSEGLGIDFSKDFHSRGIGIRHMGLIRSYFWRELPGLVHLHFHDAFVHTTKDLREEIQHGDKLRVEGEIYHVEISESKLLTFRSVPLKETFFGPSRNELKAAAGRLSSDRYSKELRSIFLAEMIARTVKSMIKLQLRQYGQAFATSNYQFIAETYAEYFNIITGAHAQSHSILEERVFEGVRDRFGKYSLRPSERSNIVVAIRPCIKYIIKRLQKMLGASISVTSLAEFHANPLYFAFISQDFLEIVPVIKHNIPIMAYADAKLVTLRAEEAERETYLYQILLDDPPLIFRLSERIGSRELENRGYLGQFQSKYQEEMRQKKKNAAQDIVGRKLLGNGEEDDHDFDDEENENEDTNDQVDKKRKGKKSTLSGFANRIITGFYSPNCQLECDGPLKSDPFTRSVKFSPAQKTYIESKFHPHVVPLEKRDHFSIESFFWLDEGGVETTRTILMCGRYALLAGRKNILTFVFFDGMYEVPVKLLPDSLPSNAWIHCIVTFDGTSIRGYLNGEEVTVLEIESPLLAQIQDEQEAVAESLRQLEEDEASERQTVKDRTQQEAEKYFALKEGSYAMKKAAQHILESQEFQRMNVGSEARDEMGAMKMKKQEAMRLAKVNYTTDLYVKNVKEVSEKFALKREEVKDAATKRQEDGVRRSRQGLRIGSMMSASSLKEGKNFFWGRISCVSIYTRCLSVDRIRLHFSTAMIDRTVEAQRFYALAALKFEEALLHASEDLMILRGYARSLCHYLSKEQLDQTTTAIASAKKSSLSTATFTFSAGFTQGQSKVLEAIQEFTWRRIPEGIAEILRYLPREVNMADLLCEGLFSILDIDPKFFSGGRMPSTDVTGNIIQPLLLSDLIELPRLYALDDIHASETHIRAAATIYREVTKDLDLRFAYGDQNFSWLHQIACHELVTALVRHAREDKSLEFVNLGEMYDQVFGGNSNYAKFQHSDSKNQLMASMRSIMIEDADLEVLAYNLSLTKGFNFSNCRLLSNSSLLSLSRLKSVKVIHFDNCPLITNSGLKPLLVLADQLESLSFAYNQNLDAEGLQPLFEACHELKSVNLNHCPLVDEDLLFILAQYNTALRALFVSGTHISDDGLSLLATKLSKKSFTSLDISFCRLITDFGLTSIAETCTNLKFLNLCGLNRISDVGTRTLCSKCWYLEYLNLEDLFLLDDKSFWFSVTFDGRIAADENMLKSVKFLNLRDCVNITDQGIRGLAERCRKIESLILRGCDKISNLGLTYLTQNFLEPLPLCDSLKVLDLSFCALVSAEGLEALLPYCGVLEELKLSGNATINDDFIVFVTQKCATIQRLTLQHCIFVTDVGVCAIAESMWMEYLDISGCHKVTDAGVEILSLTCQGLQQLILTGLYRLSDTSIYAIYRNCRQLLLLNVEKCPDISSKALVSLQKRHSNVKIFS